MPVHQQCRNSQAPRHIPAIREVRTTPAPWPASPRKHRSEIAELQLDLQEIGFSDVPGLELFLADVHRLLKVLQVLLGKLQRRLRQQPADELLADIEDQGAFRIGDLRTGDGSCIPGGLQPVLTFPAAFEEVAEADVELLYLVQIAA